MQWDGPKPNGKCPKCGHPTRVHTVKGGCLTMVVKDNRDRPWENISVQCCGCIYSFDDSPGNIDELPGGYVPYVPAK